MKYTKSSSPYVALLIFLLAIAPFINHKTQETQHIVVEIESSSKNKMNSFAKFNPFKSEFSDYAESGTNVIFISEAGQP